MDPSNGTPSDATPGRSRHRRVGALALRIIGIIVILILGVVLLPEIEMLPMELPRLRALLP